MDKEPFIIKSGKGHSVEIEQGSTHARRKSNVVAPQDEAHEERVVKESVQEERKLADLGAQGVDVEPGPAAATVAEQAETSSTGGRASQVDVPDGDPAAAGQSGVQVESVAAGAAQDGPVMVLEARAEEDAKAAKGDIASDRYLSGDASRDRQDDARGPKEEVLADRFASDQPETPPDEDLRGGPPEQALTNRQKVELIQAQANRIQIEQAESAPAELVVERHARDRATQPTFSSEPEPVAAPAIVEDDKPLVGLAVASEGLPPELEGNLGFAPAAAPQAQESGLLARVRALRSNMSVTDDRLSKLQSKPPIKP
ncbi:MAG: hypothetical protein ACKOFG_01040 [Limnohabitans sp.]